MAKLIEKVYGDALFELADEAGRTSEFMQEVQAIRQILAENPEFSRLMEHPGIPLSEKEKALETVWEGHVSRELTGFMLLLLKKEHYGKLSDVLDYFIARVKEKDGIGIAYVKTALPLSKEEEKKVEKRLLETTGYQSFEMHYEVDASLIGGVIIRIGDRVVDNTIKSRLESLSRQLYQIKLQ